MNVLEAPLVSTQIRLYLSGFNQDAQRLDVIGDTE